MHVMNEPESEAEESHSDTPTPEQVAAQVIRELRQARGWSQQEVAERMRSYGYAWSQATVTRLEAASRPIRLNELADLASLFGVPMIQVLDAWFPGPGSDDLHALEAEIVRLSEERERVHDQMLAASEQAAQLRADLQERETEAEMASRRMAWLDAKLGANLGLHPHALDALLRPVREVLGEEAEEALRTLAGRTLRNRKLAPPHIEGHDQ